MQLDEVAVALLCDPAICNEVKRTGSNPDTLVDLYIAGINQAVSKCPADVTIGVHMCRGNFKGRYLGAGGYESVAERFFAQTNVNHFLLEYDTARAGDFAPLRFVPKSKGVVLGLISTKTPVLESLDELKRRAEEAARYIDLNRLAISLSADLPAPWLAIRLLKWMNGRNWRWLSRPPEPSGNRQRTTVGRAIPLPSHRGG